MASYKVPQDVEADDKLIGPFSFRQFVYLIIVAMAIAAAWGLAQIFVGLVVIPLPIIVFFGALALPLRKDQPMEIYLAALVSFFLKPHKRLWDPEGIETLIEISAPKVVEVTRTKGLSQNEAEQRLSYLANIVDSGGWAIRGAAGGGATSMNNDIYLEAQSATDVLDTNTSVAHSFDQMMNQSTERLREEARARMSQVVAAPAAPVHFDPYPAINQSVIQPLSGAAYAPNPVEATVAPAPVATMAPISTATASSPAPVANQPAQATETPDSDKTTATTSGTALSAGIMSLANNPDLSIETIAHEAKRLQKKAADESEEVVISLR